MSWAITWRIRAGFSLALLCLLTVSVSVVLSRVDVLWLHHHDIVIGIGVTGLVLLLGASVKRALAAARAAEREEAPASDRLDRPLAFFSTLLYWGFILATAAYPILYFSEYLYRQRHPPQELAAPVNHATNVVETPEPTPIARPAEFPPLKVGGFICNGPKSTVVLNGRTVALGESLEGVKVVAIETFGIAVELDGHRKWLEAEH